MQKTPEERFGARVRFLRAARGWTQEDLRKKSHLSREHISRIENGHQEAGLRVIDTLAKTFSISISELMHGV